MNRNNILGGLFVAVPLAAFAFFGVSATSAFAHVALSGYGDDKVKVCHNKNTIEVKASAVAAHLAHGDTLGKCVKKDDKKDDKKDKKDEKHDNKDDRGHGNAGNPN